MSDNEELKAEAAATEAAEGPVAGERLAEARREQQVSVLEVAKELHLDEGKVRALERNEFDVLGAPVFAKGHLKKYADLVGVDVEDVLTEYYKLTRAERPPPLVVGRKRVKKELSPGPWIVVIIVLVALAAAYWWLFERQPMAGASAPERSAPAATAPASREVQGGGEAPPAQPPAQAAAPAPAPASAAGTGARAGDVSGPGAAGSEPAAASGSAATSGPATGPGPAAGSAPADVRLTVTFSGDCWTEISDAEGRRMYFGMGREGQTVDLVGVAPVSALFGNAANVQLFVDGEEYALPGSAPNQPVRLSLESQR